MPSLKARKPAETSSPGGYCSYIDTPARGTRAFAETPDPPRRLIRSIGRNKQIGGTREKGGVTLTLCLFVDFLPPRLPAMVERRS
jgi:hypothetical protein